MYDSKLYNTVDLYKHANKMNGTEKYFRYFYFIKMYQGLNIISTLVIVE